VSREVQEADLANDEQRYRTGQAKVLRESLRRARNSGEPAKLRQPDRIAEERASSIPDPDELSHMDGLGAVNPDERDGAGAPKRQT